nr:MAG TPA: hypothetical protein [Caudoviricetes sp.]
MFSCILQLMKQKNIRQNRRNQFPGHSQAFLLHPRKTGGHC